MCVICLVFFPMEDDSCYSSIVIRNKVGVGYSKKNQKSLMNKKILQCQKFSLKFAKLNVREITFFWFIYRKKKNSREKKIFIIFD